MTFNTNLPVMVFIDIKICLTTKKKLRETDHQNSQKYCLYNKTAHLNLKHFVPANLNKKYCISRYSNQNPPHLNLNLSFQTTKIPFLPVVVITYMSFLFTSAVLAFEDAQVIPLFSRKETDDTDETDNKDDKDGTENTESTAYFWDNFGIFFGFFLDTFWIFFGSF